MKLRKRWPTKRLLGYCAVLGGAWFVAVLAGLTTAASRLDNYAYDQFFNSMPPARWMPQSVVLAIDEKTLQEMGGPRAYRGMLTEALQRLKQAQPRAVAIDMILADKQDEREDAALEAAMRATPNLVLSCEAVENRYELPLARFAQAAAAIGEAHLDRDKQDGVGRLIRLEKSVPGDRRWALPLETFRVFRGAQSIVESPEDLEVGGMRVPASRKGGDRPLRIRFLQEGIPTVSLATLIANPAMAAAFSGKAVFIGVTALSAARDRVVIPYGRDLAGVEINAQVFETLAQGSFLEPASDATVLFYCLLLAAGAGCTFAFLSGWPAYIVAALLILAAHSIPAVMFAHGIVFPYSASISAAWLGVVGAAAFQFFVMRGELGKSESDKARYQQAIHFVTHEMRTPLTAIQGSSELMGRYNLSDDKRKQMAQMINFESKRLARMVQTFLDVERLSEGQMELKREAFSSRVVVESCVERVAPLAERKRIRIFLDSVCDDAVIGDRELMEYAVYNLLTNAIKYSPEETEVHVDCTREGPELRLAVRDQGIGMDAKELRNVFKKFYRTKKAEASGEVGTGIGLSIVEQIVANHGGRMEVSSAPGRGSNFAIVLPTRISLPAR